jgi:hypothetical protein
MVAIITTTTIIITTIIFIITTILLLLSTARLFCGTIMCFKADSRLLIWSSEFQIATSTQPQRRRLMIVIELVAALVWYESSKYFSMLVAGIFSCCVQHYHNDHPVCLTKGYTLDWKQRKLLPMSLYINKATAALSVRTLYRSCLFQPDHGSYYTSCDLLHPQMLNALSIE